MVAAIAAALLLPAAPAPAQEDDTSWSLSTKPLTFKAGGVAYQLSVSAVESPGSFGGESVHVTISRTSDPTGVRFATQAHTYSFRSLQGVFDHTDNLSTASIVTGTQLGKWGKLKLNFRQNAAVDRSCGGDVMSRAGTISGSLELKTGTKRFGTINNRPSKALLTSSNVNSTCGNFSDACPLSGSGLSGWSARRRGGMHAFKANGAKTAAISFYWTDELDSPARTLSHYSLATVPAKNVTVAKNLGTATVRGAKRTFLSGESTFTANGGASQSPPYPCGKTKEVATTSVAGTVNGNLKVASFLGKGIGASAMSVSANKTVVRSR